MKDEENQYVGLSMSEFEIKRNADDDSTSIIVPSH